MLCMLACMWAFPHDVGIRLLTPRLGGTFPVASFGLVLIAALSPLVAWQIYISSSFEGTSAVADLKRVVESAVLPMVQYLKDMGG